MKTFKRLSEASHCARASSRFASSSLTIVFSLGFLMLLFSGFAEAQTNAAAQSESLAPWIGVWSITDDQTSPGATVEIQRTIDGRGLEISRKMPPQPDVKEVLIPDGSKRPIEAPNCSGWQTAQWVSDAGLIIGSSETNCKGSGSFATSSLRMILANDRMADILAIKAAGQTRLAVRRLVLQRELAPSGETQSSLAAAAARTALSAPWSLSTIMRLSGIVNVTVLEAALIEKNAQLNLTSKSLKQMKAARVPNEIIDLLVALAFPNQFDIQKNGQVALKPLSAASMRGSSGVSYYPPGLSYYPGAFYNCYSPYGYYFGYVGLYSPDSCWSYYSPLWWDYPISFPSSGGIENNARLSAHSGYVQIEPRETGRHARPREGYVPGSGSSGTRSSAVYDSSTGSWSGGSSAGSSGGGSSSSGAGASASPGGYSSGGDGGGKAVPR